MSPHEFGEVQVMNELNYDLASQLEKFEYWITFRDEVKKFRMIEGAEEALDTLIGRIKESKNH